MTARARRPTTAEAESRVLAAGASLAPGGRFTLPDLARASGVGSAAAIVARLRKAGRWPYPYPLSLGQSRAELARAHGCDPSRRRAVRRRAAAPPAMPAGLIHGDARRPAVDLQEARASCRAMRGAWGDPAERGRVAYGFAASGLDEEGGDE